MNSFECASAVSHPEQCRKETDQITMSTPKADQTPLLQQEDGVEFQNEREAVGQVIHNMKKLKSFDILKSALAILTSDFKVFLSLILSIIPFFVFMVFFEIKLRKVAVAAPSALQSPYGSPRVTIVRLTNGSRRMDIKDDNNDEIMVFLYDVLQVCVLYLTVFPLLELLSMVTTIKIAVKVYAGEKLATLKDAFCGVNNLNGVLITCFYVQLLSILSLLGLSWIAGNGPLVLLQLGGFWELDITHFVYVLLLGLHAALFVFVLHKYLYWSAFWNMSMVISVLEEEGGMAAFGLASYYGRHCRPTGFQLILGFVGFNVVLRLPCLYGGLCNWSTVAGIAVTAGIIGFICLANLVKWVAFVLYYFDCKQQTMEKKSDEEIAKPVNAETSV